MVPKIALLFTVIFGGVMNAQYPGQQQRKYADIQQECSQRPSSVTFAYQQSKSFLEAKKRKNSHLTVPISSPAGSPVPSTNEKAQPNADNTWTNNIVIPFVIPQDTQKGNAPSAANNLLPKRPILIPKPEYTYSTALSVPNESRISPIYSMKIPKKKHLFLADLCDATQEQDKSKQAIKPQVDKKACFEKLEALKKDFTIFLINPPKSFIEEAFHAHIPVEELIKKTFILNHLRITQSIKDTSNSKNLIMNAENTWNEICAQSTRKGKNNPNNCCALQ